MPRLENHLQRMNVNEDSSEKSKQKTQQSSSDITPPIEKAPLPIPASPRVSYVGRRVQVRLRNGKIVNGLCVDPGFVKVVKLQNAYIDPGAGFENVIFPKKMHHSEIELGIDEIIEIDTALGNQKKRFATDGEYSVGQEVMDGNLVQWDGGDAPEMLDGGESKGGWSVEEMFQKNKDLGVQSSFKDDLTQYTTCDAKGTEEERAKAAAIAREIERNDKSKRMAFLENDDEERDIDKETAVPEAVPKPIEDEKPQPPEAQKQDEDTTTKKFTFDPDAPSFVPKPPQSAPVVEQRQHQPRQNYRPPQPPSLLAQSIPNTGPPNYIVAQSVPLQHNGNVITHNYVPQQIPVIYNPQMINNSQQMQTIPIQQVQTIPSLISSHPSNIVIQNPGDYQNAYVQQVPSAVHVQQVPMYRLPVQVQQQPVAVYQMRPQIQQQQQQSSSGSQHSKPQQHYQQQRPPRLPSLIPNHNSQYQQHSPRRQYRNGVLHYNAPPTPGSSHQPGGSRHKFKNHGPQQRNDNHWQSQPNQQNYPNHHNHQQNHQSNPRHQVSQQQQHVSQPRFPQVISQNPVYIPQLSQMAPIYINHQNTPASSATNANIVSMMPMNMVPPQYVMPQAYQRIDNNNVNNVIQVPQNKIIMTPNIGMQQQLQQPHIYGQAQILPTQPPTPALNNQESSPPIHFPPNVNVPPPPLPKKMTPMQPPAPYPMQPPPIVIPNHSQVVLVHTPQGQQPPVSTYIMMPQPPMNITMQYPISATYGQSGATAYGYEPRSPISQQQQGPPQPPQSS